MLNSVTSTPSAADELSLARRSPVMKTSTKLYYNIYKLKTANVATGFTVKC